MTLAETIIAALDESVLPVTEQDGFRDSLRDNRMLTKNSLARSRNNTYGPKAGLRAINLHDAIASILVSAARSEVVAVGSAVVGKLLTIYLASNGTSLQNASQHLTNLWEMLRKISHDFKESRKLPPHYGDIVNNHALHDEFQSLVYAYSIEKVLKHFSKGDRLRLPTFFDEVLKPGSGYVLDEPPASGLSVTN